MASIVPGRRLGSLLRRALSCVPQNGRALPPTRQSRIGSVIFKASSSDLQIPQQINVFRNLGGLSALWLRDGTLLLAGVCHDRDGILADAWVLNRGFRKSVLVSILEMSLLDAQRDPKSFPPAGGCADAAAADLRERSAFRGRG